MLGRLRRRKESDQKIIDSVHGRVESGQLVALLGVSGCGKTTLLSAVTGRLPKNYTMKGKVTLNGDPDPGLLRKNLSHVDQFESFPVGITPRQHMLYNALLRLNRKMTYEDKLAVVDETIKLFGLSKCAHTIIGNPGFKTGLSGGERRRLGMATEAMLKTPFIICDEPTSGLDSFMSTSVVQTMKTLTASGCGVLCSIHQPSSSAFALFDRVMLMAEGRVAFYGTTQEALHFFSRFNYTCPERFNYSDFFLGILMKSLKENSNRSLQVICDEFDKQVTATKHELDSKPSPPSTSKIITNLSFETSWWTQTLVLTKRELSGWRSCRNWFFYCIYFVSFTSISLSSRVQLPLRQQTTNDVVGITAWLSSTGTSFFALLAMTEFTGSRPLFYKERVKNMYSTSAFIVSHFVCEILESACRTIYFVTPFYWTFGFNTSFTGFLTMWLIMFLNIIMATEFAHFGCAIINMPQASRVSWTIIVMVLNSFNHFYRSHRDITVWISWLTYFSWAKYGMECISILQWVNFKGNIECDPRLITCLHNGKEVLRNLGIDSSLEFSNLGYMLAVGVGFRVLLSLTLYVQSRPR